MSNDLVRHTHSTQNGSPASLESTSIATLHIKPKKEGNTKRNTALTVVSSWKPVKLELQSFPDKSVNAGGVPVTIANVRYLLTQNNIDARYNVIKKKTEVFIPGLGATSDNVDNVTLAHVRSLMALHGIPKGDARAIVDAVADANPYNPVADWIRSKPWDGVDRLSSFYATLTTPSEYPEALKHTIVYKWTLSAVAAALMPEGFSARLVLVLQGAQSIGKTRWCMALVPDWSLRSSVVKTDHHFEGGNKDHIITAMRHWIVELGELESSFRKDAERLKGIITRDRDVVRIPYASADSDWPRRTVFMATANGSDFLSDPTGSTRWGIVPVESVDYEHGIDMQQLYAQLAADLENEVGWWLTPPEEAELEAWNERYRASSPIRDAVVSLLDFDGDDTASWERLTAGQILAKAGIEKPTPVQSRDCGALLRAKFGLPTSSKHGSRWNVPLRPIDLEHHRHPEATPTLRAKSKFD